MYHAESFTSRELLIEHPDSTCGLSACLLFGSADSYLFIIIIIFIIIIGKNCAIRVDRFFVSKHDK